VEKYIKKQKKEGEKESQILYYHQLNPPCCGET